MELVPKLPFSRKWSTWDERHAFLSEILKISYEDLSALFINPHKSISDSMVESAVGYFPEPLGIVWSLPVNGKFYHVPMATEETSVIAAANYMAKILEQNGMWTEVVKTVLSGQIYIKSPLKIFQSFWERNRYFWEEKLKSHLSSMEKRGGGYLSSELRFLEELCVVVWDVFIDPCDAQGANTINELLEYISSWLSEQGWEVVLKILSNSLNHNPSRAFFSLPLSRLEEFGYGNDVVKRLVFNSKIGHVDPVRATTHNKGIMNGISALALATGNDTRALEAGVHTFASRTGKMKALSLYRIEGDRLIGEIELPLALATVGGATKVHPTSSLSLKILGISSSQELKEVAISLGLAQNLGAMLALSSYGIQKGHMALYKRRNRILGEKNGTNTCFGFSQYCPD